MAYRFIFESDGDQVRLVRKMRVDMLAPEQPAETAERAPGVYAEVRNADEETLFRASLSAQVHPTVEVFAPSGKVERMPDQGNRKRVAIVVVPESPEAASVVVVRRRPEGDAQLHAMGDEEEEVLERVSLLDDETSR